MDGNDDTYASLMENGDIEWWLLDLGNGYKIDHVFLKHVFCGNLNNTNNGKVILSTQNAPPGTYSDLPVIPNVYLQNSINSNSNDIYNRKLDNPNKDTIYKTIGFSSEGSSYTGMRFYELEVYVFDDE
jgi:hypothetical protein